jgi:putative transposase
MMANMKKARFIEDRFLCFPKQSEAGLPIKELCRESCFRTARFYK